MSEYLSKFYFSDEWFFAPTVRLALKMLEFEEQNALWKEGKHFHITQA